MTSSKKDDLFLFDFDGVVCDSCDECTVSALRTCQRLGVFNNSGEEYDKDAHGGTWNNLTEPPPWLFDKMREIRPAIEIGWQIPVLLSVFLEQQRTPAKAISVEKILANYQSLVDHWLRRNGKTEENMIEAFGSVRDDWIQEDLTSWLDINRFYTGVPEAINSCEGTPILVTTKQQRFAIALCRHAGVTSDSLPDETIYGLGQYKNKADVIANQMIAGNFAPGACHFFEDRWPTLAKCLKDPRLDGVHLYLCSWGYVAEKELELAKAEPRVTVLSLNDFSQIVGSHEV